LMLIAECNINEILFHHEILIERGTYTVRTNYAEKVCFRKAPFDHSALCVSVVHAIESCNLATPEYLT